MLESTAMRLSAEVLKTLGEVMNSEHRELVASTKDGETSNSMFNGDCRVFRDFVKIHSFYSCTAFINGTTDNNIRAKVSTLHRKREICISNGFQTVHHKDISQQYWLSLSAIAEEKNFLNHMPGSKRHSFWEVARNNLFRSTMLGKEITSNMGNENGVLPAILDIQNMFSLCLAAKWKDAINIVKIRNAAEKSPPEGL